MASGRRIKRRGSGRSSNDEMEVSGAGAAAPLMAGEHSASCAAEEAEQATRVHKLLDAQKRAYEVRPCLSFYGYKHMFGCPVACEV